MKFIRRDRSLDALVLAALLALAVAPFIGAVAHSENIIFGIDLTQHYSREMVNRLAFKETWVPLWNPYEFSGFPAQADPQVGVFYPPSILLRLFAVPTFLTLTVVLHVWMAGVGAYVLCRVLGLRRAPAAMAGIGLMLSGVTLGRVYAGHLDVLRAFGWTPLALAAAIKSIDRMTIRPTTFAVIALSLHVLAFYPQLICYTVGAIVLYAAFSVIWPTTVVGELWPRARRAAIHLLLLMAFVSGLTAFQLLPTARLIMAAGRTHGLSYESAADSAIRIREFAGDVFAPARDNTVPNESWETSAYVGWLPAALAPFALLARRRWRIVAFFILLAGLSLALATGGPLYRLHYSIFPMFRIPGRLIGFWAIAITVLGAVGLEWLLDCLNAWRSDRQAPFWRRVEVVIPTAASAIVAADLLSYAHHFIRIEPFRERFVSSLPFRPTQYGRVLSLCEGRAQTSDLTALGIPSIDGYNSYFPWDYAHLAERAMGQPPSTSLERGFPRIGTETLADLDAVNALNVTEIITCDPLPLPGLQLQRQASQSYLYRNPQAFGRVTTQCVDDAHSRAELSAVCDAGAVVKVLAADTPKGVLRFRVLLPAPRTLLLAEPYYPERRAWVDDVEVPVEKANIALSAIQVSAGAHIVELRYVPTSLRVGALISVVALLLSIAVLRG